MTSSFLLLFALPAAADPTCYIHLRGETVDLAHLCGSSSPSLSPDSALPSAGNSIQPGLAHPSQRNLPNLQPDLQSAGPSDLQLNGQPRVPDQLTVNLPLLETVEFVSDPARGPMLVGSLYNPTTEPTVEAGIYGVVNTTEQYHTETAIAPVIEPYRWARFELPVGDLRGDIEDFRAEVFVLPW
ncbi:MAG: hypothetical protein AAF152_10010 [Cyanobacteria bacterium P01_A01_bin.114]